MPAPTNPVSPNDLTRPDVEVERRSVRPSPHAAGRQHDIRSGPGLVVQRRGHPPEHGLHEFAGAERARQDPCDDTVTEYHDSIGHVLDLDEVVGNEQNGDTAPRQTAHRHSRRSVSRADRLDVGSSRMSTLT